jgi:hypothetical protein
MIMVFNKSEHKELCKQLIQNASFSGQVLDLVFEFKQAMEDAVCKEKYIPVPSTEC